MAINRSVINGAMIVSVIGTMMFSATEVGATDTGKVAWVYQSTKASMAASSTGVGRESADVVSHGRGYGRGRPQFTTIDPTQATMPAASATTAPVPEFEDDDELVDPAW